MMFNNNHCPLVTVNNMLDTAKPTIMTNNRTTRQHQTISEESRNSKNYSNTKHILSTRRLRIKNKSSNKMMILKNVLTTITIPLNTLLLLLLLLSLKATQAASNNADLLASGVDYSSINQQQQHQQVKPASASSLHNYHHQIEEIFVQPNSQVHLECKLPNVANGSKNKYLWNFQRTSEPQGKVHVLAFRDEMFEQDYFGYQLLVDHSSGVYDLKIRNASYEVNDGIYGCEYGGQSRQIRLTVLSK